MQVWDAMTDADEEIFKRHMIYLVDGMTTDGECISSPESVQGLLFS
jgi:hypothetical protein